MIIYKIEESGEATNFQGAFNCPDGWLSIEVDKIPLDTSQYNTQAYRDILAQKKINEDARKFLAENDWKVIRHIRHEKLVELGELEQADLTDQEYKDLLLECQRQADLVIE